MAYKKRTKSSTRKRTTGYTKRRSTSSRSTKRSPKRSGRTVQTLRIVVEQPSAVSSVGGVVPMQTQSARKAQF